MIESVVIATDGSQSGYRAINVALDLADRFDASVHALYVLDSDEVSATPADVREDVRNALTRQGESALSQIQASTEGELVTAVRNGRPAIEIMKYARDIGADVIAVGTRGRHGEHRLLLGSVAEEIVRRSEVPVLSVRQLEELPAGSGSSHS